MSNIAFYVVSDVHGYIFPTDFTSRNQYQPMGLLLANHVIEQDRRQYDQSFKIDNGDFLQGSPFCNYLIAHSGSSQPLVDFYNRMAFNFGTLGNHEFNYGLPYLKDTLRRLNYPVLCANIYENDSTLTDNGVQYFQVGDQTVGVIGLTTQFIPHWEQPEHIQSLTFHSAFETLQQHLPEMKRHADIIVVCYHGGFEKDLESGMPTEVLTGENEGYAMLEAFSKDIDIFITGHQHRQIAERFKQTAVIQPGTRGTTVGKVVLSTDEYENVSVESCELLPVIDDSTFTIDEDDQHLRKQLEDWLDYEITTLPYDMTINHAFEARVAPHPFTNFMNYALLEKSGAKLKEAIERSAEYFDVKNDEVSVSADFLEPKPQHFNYDIYGGVSYNIHVGRPKGQRVSNMMIQGHAVDLKQTYTICVNNYRAVGGGQYDMYIDAPVVKDIQVEGAQLLIDFLSNNNLMRIPQVVDFKVEK
ncbi:bifunctional metallophosphatase/5'-nucleotidase [Staphylococcus aureus]|nr:bifunctional metallophosphatase/5'-nucleotidase [Staphylococcus aureus]